MAMKQLFYTSCKQDVGLQARAGLQVRAASRGVGENTLRAATRYCYYFLPFGDEFRPDIVSPRDAPIRFAFMQTQELGPIALQAVYFGVDPASGRPGNPFVHMVLDDVDQGLDALKVLASWRSPFWQADAEGCGKELQSVESLPGDGLDEETLVAKAKEEDWKEYVAFLFNAYLQTEDAQQIFIVGEPSEIIAMLYAVARLVPTATRRKLSFSTYERDVDGQLAKFVGTTWGKMSTDRDLPEYLYSGRGVSLNLKSGRSSDGLLDLSYTRFAVQSLVNNALAESVDPFLTFCEQCEVSEPRDLDSVYRHFFAQSSDLLAQQDLEVVFRYPALKSHALQNDIFCRKIVTSLRDGSQQLATFVEPLCSQLSADKQAASEMSNQLFTVFIDGINAGATVQLQSLRSYALPILPDANQVLVRVFRHFADQKGTPYESMNLETWSFLVEIWIENRLTADDTSRMNRWLLAGDPDGLAQLLYSVSSEDFQLRIFKLNLANEIKPKRETWDALFVGLAREGDALSAVFHFGPAIISSGSPTAPVVRDAWRKLCEAVLNDKKSCENQEFIKNVFRVRLGIISPDESGRKIFLEDRNLEDVGRKLFKKMKPAARSALSKESAQWDSASRKTWKTWEQSKGGVFSSFKRMLFKRSTGVRGERFD